MDYLTEGIKRTPYKHQLEAVSFFRNKPDGFLFFEMGCVSADTEIFINRSGASKRMTIAEAYSKVPNMRNKDGSLPEIYTRAFNGTKIGLHKIVKVLYSGKKEVMNLTLEDGKSIRLTPDHEVMTENGFIQAKDLSTNDLVMVDTPRPVPTKGRTKINYLYTRVKDHPYGRKKIRRLHTDKVETYYIVPTHRLIAEKELNNGEFLDPEVYAVHHKDFDPRNNDPSNLEICTHEEHRKIHAESNSNNFSQGVVSYSRVKSVVTIGVQDTYDIVCEDPHRNFVANGIVVHNCGKTGTAVLTYRAWNQREFRQLRCLVICPSVVIYNWRDEFGLFSKMDLNDVLPLAKGSGKHKAELVYDNFVKDMKSGVIITNYEALLTQELFTAIQRWNPEVIIFDEVHYLKNPNSKRSKICRRLAESAIYRLGLTGTPILKNVMDMYGIFNTVDLGKTFGTNQYIFQARYLIDKNAHWKSKTGYFPKWENNPKTFEELNELVYKKSLRKLKSECLDLPDLIKTVRLVEWGKDQKKAYDELKRDFLTFIASSRKDGEPESVTANLALTKALRMLQVASGFVQTDDGNIHEFTDVPRLEECRSLLAEIVGDNEQKCILWCSYKYNYKMLARICDELGFKYVFITGEQNTTEKREAELAFRDNPEVMVAICNRRAGGIGVNLVAASHSIVYSRNFSLDEELQSEARNHRGGSERHQSIVKIDLAVKDSIDEDVLLALRNKHQVAGDILDMVK